MFEIISLLASVIAFGIPFVFMWFGIRKVIKIFIPYPSSNISKLLYLAQIRITFKMQALFPLAAPIQRIS